MRFPGRVSIVSITNAAQGLLERPVHTLCNFQLCCQALLLKVITTIGRSFGDATSFQMLFDDVEFVEV